MRVLYGDVYNVFSNTRKMIFKFVSNQESIVDIVNKCQLYNAQILKITRILVYYLFNKILYAIYINISVLYPRQFK